MCERWEWVGLRELVLGVGIVGERSAGRERSQRVGWVVGVGG